MAGYSYRAAKKLNCPWIQTASLSFLVVQLSISVVRNIYIYSFLSPVCVFAKGLCPICLNMLPRPWHLLGELCAPLA